MLLLQDVQRRPQAEPQGHRQVSSVVQIEVARGWLLLLLLLLLPLQLCRRYWWW